MQVIRIYRREGGLAVAFKPFFQDEDTFLRNYPEGPYLWLR